MVWVRWAAIALAAVQIATFYLPYPPGVLPAAIGVWAVLVAGNTLAALALARVRTREQARRLAAAAIILDSLVAAGWVAAYTFDLETAIWVVLYVPMLEAGVRFGLRAGLLAAGGLTLFYAAREWLGAVVYGHPFLIQSITFRMGVGWIIAWVSGQIASQLRRERDDLEAATGRLEASAAELEAVNRRLVEANEVKDDFVAMTNHELRTPLTTILGYTRMLTHRWERVPDARKRQFVEQVEEQAQRLNELVEDLLTLSSAQAGVLELRMQPTAVAQAVQAALANNGARAVRVRNDCPPSLAVRADPSRLAQILANYVSNALKYGHEPIVVDAVADNGAVTVRVTDAGPGVPEDFVDSLFEKFTQASKGPSRTAEGTGLGLAIVKRLADAQDGQAWYEPTGQGARFCVRLPQAEGEPPPGDTATR